MQDINCQKCGKFLGKVNIINSLKICKGHVMFYCMECKRWEIVY